MTAADRLKGDSLDTKRQMKVLKVVEAQRVAQRRVERRAAKRALPPRRAGAPHIRGLHLATN
jgi:hypothetical protein